MSEEKNKKLGRGLSSLLSGKSFTGDSSFSETMSNQINIGIAKIIPNDKQPRKNFNKEEIQNLSSYGCNHVDNSSCYWFINDD